MLENFSQLLTLGRLFIPCSSKCSSHPKEQGLALPHCGPSHGESGPVAARGTGPGAVVQIALSAPHYLWQLCTGRAAPR